MKIDIEKYSEDFLNQTIKDIVKDIQLIFGCNESTAKITAATYIQYPNMLVELTEMKKNLKK